MTVIQTRVQRAGPPARSGGGVRVARRGGAAEPPGRSGVGRPRAIGSPGVLEVVMARLRVICEPTRVQLMVLLDQGGRATVQQLTDRLPTTHQNVSKHLRVLHDAGMVARSRDGIYVYYELADWSALWLVEQIASSTASHLELQQEALRTVA